MPTAVVILPSSTYRASDFLAAAESIGIDLVVASEQPPPIDMGDRYLQIDCSDPGGAADQIALLGETKDIDGVVAADDQGVLVAAAASKLMGLRGNSPEAARATRDKLEMRQRLGDAEVGQPRYVAVAPGDDAVAAAEQVGFPLVMKPLDRSASQGVVRVEDAEGLEPALEMVRGIIEPDASLIFEEYLPGFEVAIEGMVSDSELTILAVFDKPDTPEGPYFPETIFLTPSRLSEADLAETTRVAAAAVHGLGLTQGPVHVELRIADRRARVIEVAARSIGGLCSRSLNFGLMGTTLESLILRNAMGLGRTHLRRESVASGVLMVPTPESGILKTIEGVDQVRSIEGITGMDFTMVPGDRVEPPPIGARYLGFVYARSDNPDKVELALREALGTLKVQLEG